MPAFEPAPAAPAAPAAEAVAPVAEMAAAAAIASQVAPTAPPASAPDVAPAAAYPPMAGYTPVQPMVAPKRNGGAAIVVEVIAGLFGFFGVGWLMSGFTTTGLFLLIGGIIWLVVGFLLSVVSLVAGGFGFPCMVVVDVIVAIVSAVVLNNRLKGAR
jgi:hypothetical protein